MTAALALSAYLTAPPTGVGQSAPTAKPTAPAPVATFDGLLAEVAQELLADNPELDAAITQESQRFAEGDAPVEMTASEAVDLDAVVDETPVTALDDTSSAAFKSEFEADFAALVELDDTRHVFVASAQWTPPSRTGRPAEPALQDEMEPPSDPSLPMDTAPTLHVNNRGMSERMMDAVQASPVLQALTNESDLFDARLTGLSAVEPMQASPIVQVEQALNAIQGDGFPSDDLTTDDGEGDASTSPLEELDTAAPVKRVDPVAMRTLDGLPVAEPVLVSVDSLDSVDASTAVDISLPVDTPELPVAPLDLDVVRVDIDDDLAVEVRTVDGEVDVALLGADAVKPVMKGVQAELRESLKRGGYDLGQFERSEQDQAERRHRRRQHQHQERRDPRRGALL